MHVSMLWRFKALLLFQGMHEVLAPLIFVLHCDHQAHQHANEMDPTT